MFLSLDPHSLSTKFFSKIIFENKATQVLSNIQVKNTKVNIFTPLHNKCVKKCGVKYCLTSKCVLNSVALPEQINWNPTNSMT